jgi:hypothetical protein
MLAETPARMIVAIFSENLGAPRIEYSMPNTRAEFEEMTFLS